MSARRKQLGFFKTVFGFFQFACSGFRSHQVCRLSRVKIEAFFDNL